MTEKISEDTTRKVANLARLALTDAEVTAFTKDLGDILEYVEKLSEVNVNGVEAIVHPIQLSIPLREDEAAEPELNSDGQPRVLDSAPEVLYEGYKVPPIL